MNSNSNLLLFTFDDARSNSLSCWSVTLHRITHKLVLNSHFSVTRTILIVTKLLSTVAQCPLAHAINGATTQKAVAVENQQSRDQFKSFKTTHMIAVVVMARLGNTNPKTML